MATPGRKIILDLLAKSVAKINADYPESVSKSREKKRKKFDNEKSIKKKKKKTTHDDDNEQDCLPLSNYHLKSIKTEVKTDNIKIETENTDDIVKVEGTFGFKTYKVKTEYLEIKTEHTDDIKMKLEDTFGFKTNKVKTEYIEIKTENTDDIKLKLEGTFGFKTYKVKTEYLEIKTENTDDIKLKLEGTSDFKTNKVKTEYIKLKAETSYSNVQENEVTSTMDTPGRRYILDLLAKSVSKIKVAKSENDAVEDMEQSRQKNSKVKTVKTKHLELNTIKEPSDKTKTKAEDLKTKTQGSIAKKKIEYENVETNCNVTKAKESKVDKNNITRKSHTLNRFSPEEDKIILHAVETIGSKISINQLAKELNRSRSAVSNRIEMLKTGGKKKARSFTNIEDLVIIDAAMKHLPGSSLEMLDLPSFGDWKQIGDQLSRRQTHVRNRWEYYLKPWLLQHFSGTLNLDIRRMLANYLADNFENVDSIDWPAVASRAEFEGHTEVSLHYYFGAYLFQGAKLKMKREVEEVTLKHIQDYENEQFKNYKLRKVSDKVLSRQKEVVDYFEKYIKQQDIKLKLYSK